MYNLCAGTDIGIGGVSKPLKTASVIRMNKSPTGRVGGLVNIMNSHTIRFYSFEPPTAFDLSMRFLFLGDKVETNCFIFNIADSVWRMGRFGVHDVC